MSKEECQEILHRYFKRLPISSDGNCLFSSLVAFFPTLTVVKLRECVARRFLDGNDIFASKTILNWVDLFRILRREFMSVKEDLFVQRVKEDLFDMNLFETVWHMREFPGLNHINVNMTDSETQYLITAEQRKYVYNAIMNREFWAEEFTLATLSNALGTHFIIVDGNKISYLSPSQRQTNKNINILNPQTRHMTEAQVYDRLRPFILRHTETLASANTNHIWLYLSAKHYQPLFFHSA